MDRQCKGGHRINWTENGGMQWTSQRTEDNGGHSFVPIAAKWLASGTDDDDEGEFMRYRLFASLLPAIYFVARAPTLSRAPACLGYSRASVWLARIKRFIYKITLLRRWQFTMVDAPLPPLTICRRSADATLECLIVLLQFLCFA